MSYNPRMPCMEPVRSIMEPHRLRHSGWCLSGVASNRKAAESREGGIQVRPSELKLLLVRLFAVTAFVCGIIGLYVGLTERVWKLGVVGWFTGGALLAVLAALLLADMYVALRRQGLV